METLSQNTPKRPDLVLVRSPCGGQEHLHGELQSRGIRRRQAYQHVLTANKLAGGRADAATTDQSLTEASLIYPVGRADSQPCQGTGDRASSEVEASRAHQGPTCQAGVRHPGATGFHLVGRTRSHDRDQQ